VRLSLDERSLAFWSIRWHRWAVESGDFEISVGSSSRDLAGSQIITIEAPSLALPLSLDSTLHEWLADDRGRVLLTGHGVSQLLADPELIKVIGTMPVSTLAAFKGMGFDLGTLKKALAAL
ncbi:MAG: beta-glucosidase, partial [Thermoleophilaceae bacterium]|nr:beta-glucosidase [Thermoleophilaceae bacterium]